MASERVSLGNKVSNRFTRSRKVFLHDKDRTPVLIEEEIVDHGTNGGEQVLASGVVRPAPSYAGDYIKAGLYDEDGTPPTIEPSPEEEDDSDDANEQESQEDTPPDDDDDQQDDFGEDFGNDDEDDDEDDGA